MTDIPLPPTGSTNWTGWAADEEATSDAFRDGVSVTELSATGTKDATTFLRGDNTWAVPAGGGGTGVALTQARNTLTGWFHFDAWAPDKTGATDITAKLQQAVDAVIAAGGGTLHVSSGRYRVDGTVYINMPYDGQPFRLLGEFVDGGLATPIPTGMGTVFYKANAGDIFRVNLKADLTPFENWYDYGGALFFERFACEGTTAATTYGIRAYRTRIVMRHVTSYILDGLMMQDRTGPAGYTGTWDNYCDQSLYEDVRFIQQKHTAMSLNGCDATVFNRISYQWPSAGAVYGIRLYYGTSVAMTGMLYSDGQHNSAATLLSFIEATGCSGLTLNGIHIEEPDQQRFFDIDSCFGINITGLHTRFRTRTLFKFTNSRGVSIDSWNAWSDVDSGFYDIDASANCSDITYRAAWITAFNAGDPTLVRSLKINDPSGVVQAVANKGVARGYVDAAAYTLAPADAFKTVDVNTTAATTITIPPTGFPVGTVITLLQYGTGQITVAPGAGVTIRSVSGWRKTAAQWREVTLTCRTATEWILTGDLAA